MIGSTILLALGASIFPLLLACVAIMISRPAPRRLLLAFYAGGLVTSVAVGIVVLNLFKDGDSALGNTKSAPKPTLSIVIGVIALLFAWVMTTKRGRALLDRWSGVRHRKHKPEPKPDSGPSWAEQRLGNASWKVALLIGAVINLPGPFYVLALGKIAKGGYGTAREVALILLFNLIMFWLLEFPLGGYLLAPEKTTEWVGALSRYVNENGLRITGGFVGLVGFGLIVQGISAAVG